MSELSANDVRLLLIKTAELYVERYKDKYEVKDEYEAKVKNPKENGVVVYSKGCSIKITTHQYPTGRVWNRAIVFAWAIAAREGDSTFVELFGEGAAQPSKVVEGMDVEVATTVGDGSRLTFVIPEVTREYAREVNEGRESDFRFIGIYSDTQAEYN